MKSCSRCGVSKPLNDFRIRKDALDGRRGVCKTCQNVDSKAHADLNREAERARLRKYYEDNKESVNAKRRAHFAESDKVAFRTRVARRRARKKALPDDLTPEQVLALHEWFEGKCALCDEPAEHLDHFIPIASGHGGTTIENMIPLCAEMNISKSDANPFTWSKRLPQEAQERFIDVVAYVAEINDLTPEGYESYVNECFKNKL